MTKDFQNDATKRDLLAEKSKRKMEEQFSKLSGPKISLNAYSQAASQQYYSASASI